MIEDVLDSEGFEWKSYKINVVGRIAALDHLKASAQINPP